MSYENKAGASEESKKLRQLNLQLIRSILNDDETSAYTTQQAIKKINTGISFSRTTYACEICQDTGIVSGKQCVCVKKKIQLAKISKFFTQCGLQAEQLNETFDSFQIEYYKDLQISDKIGLTYRRNAEKILALVKLFTRKCIDGQNGKGIYIFGEPGRGKTFLMNCVANALVSANKSFIYSKYDRLLADIQGSYGSDSKIKTEELLNTVMNIDVLLLDDLGVERPSDDAGLKLYRIIDERMIRSAPTFITSNFSIAALGSRYADEMLGRRISSRIAQLCEIHQLYCERDIRVLKALEK